MNADPVPFLILSGLVFLLAALLLVLRQHAPRVAGVCLLSAAACAVIGTALAVR